MGKSTTQKQLFLNLTVAILQVRIFLKEMQNHVFLKSNNCCLFEKQGRKIKFVQDLASSFFISVQIFNPIKGNNDLYLYGLIAISAVGFYHWYVYVYLQAVLRKGPLIRQFITDVLYFLLFFLGHKFFFKVKGPKLLQLVAMYVHVLRLVSDQLLSFIFKFLHEKMY